MFAHLPLASFAYNAPIAGLTHFRRLGDNGSNLISFVKQAEKHCLRGGRKLPSKLKSIA